MKKGFTMIELIFVIVILGILAAVAIPKLNATRDDAESAKFATNISTILGDFQSYYTSQGELADAIKTMTNVAIKETSDAVGSIQVKGKDCLKITLDKTNSLVTFKKADAADTKGVCDTVLKMDNVAQMLQSSNPCTGLGAPANGKATLSDAETAFGCNAGTIGTAKTWSIKTDGEVRFSYAASGVKW